MSIYGQGGPFARRSPKPQRQVRFLGPPLTAGRRSRPLSRQFARSAADTVLRLTPLHAALLAAACSMVQRGPSLRATLGLLRAARLLVAQESSRGGRSSDTFGRIVADADDRTQGFEAGERELPEPPVPVGDETKERMATALCAIVGGATPEEVADYLDGAFPHEVVEALERAGEREEMYAHVDLLLRIQQSPSVV